MYNLFVYDEVTIKCEIFNIVLWNWRSDWWLLFWEFQYSHFVLASQQNLSGSTAHHCKKFFFFFFFVVDGYITTSHSYLFDWSVSWWYFFTSLNKNGHNIYIYRYTHTYSHTLTHITFCLQYAKIFNWWYPVVTSLTNNVLTFY